MGLFDFIKKNIIVEKKKETLVRYYNNNDDIDYELLNGGDNSSLRSEDIKAIFLNYFKTASPIKKKNEYPSYFIYSYNIIDPVKYHKECIADGYFEKADFEQIIESYKVNELKALIEKYNIKTKKNNKKEMYENINLQLPNEIKNDIVNKSEYYVLSNKALLYIDEYTELLTLLNEYEWHISYNLYNRYKTLSPDYLQFRDIVWHIFNDRLNLATIMQKYKVVYLTYRNIANFLKDENRNKDALKYYILCLYLEFNYYGVQEQIDNFTPLDKVGRDYLLNLVNNKIVNNISKDIIVLINEMKEYYTDEILEKVFNTYPLKYHFISETDFKALLNDIFTKSTFEQDKYIDKVVITGAKIIKEL